MSRNDQYTSPGSTTWIVPAGIVSPIDLELGAPGPSGYTGDLVTGYLDVVAGDVLQINIGGMPGATPTGSTGAAGGFNGGGAGGSATASGGVGGLGGYGATDIRKNGTGVGSRVAVAGAPGGNGRNGSGGQAGGIAGAGGGPGTNGAGTSAGTNGIGGGVATQSTGGTGGATNGQNGSPGAGGAGGGTTTAASGRGGGGGGGGYFGGGGGGASSVNTGSGGGGSGSSYTDLLTTAYLYQGGNGSPSGYAYISYNLAPNAPSLSGPADSATLDRTLTQRFSWTFSDPDAGDTQSSADLRFSKDGGTTWTTVTLSSPTGYYDAAANYFTAGSWQWQVRTYDSQNAVGPWSASRFFTAVSPASAPTITYPISGGTVNQNDRVDWSLAATQQAYQVQRLGDNAGSIDTGTVYFDSGEVASSTARTLGLTFATNNRYEWIRVRCRASGLLTAWTAIRVQVSYTPPPVATPIVAANDVADTITVTWTTPAPTGGQPAATSVQVFRRHADGTRTLRAAIAQPVNGSWTYRTPATGVNYQFMIRTLSDNGQTADSAWVG